MHIISYHLLSRLSKLTVHLLNFIILALLFLLQSLLGSNSYILLVVFERIKVIFLRLQILPIIRPAFHRRLKVAIYEQRLIPQYHFKIIIKEVRVLYLSMLHLPLRIHNSYIIFDTIP